MCWQYFGLYIMTSPFEFQSYRDIFNRQLKNNFSFYYDKCIFIYYSFKADNIYNKHLAVIVSIIFRIVSEISV